MPNTSLSHIRNLLLMLFTGQWRMASWRLDMHCRGVELSMARLDELELDPVRATDYSNSGGRGWRAFSRRWIFRVIVIAQGKPCDVSIEL
jgi:hypothetical protein